MLFSICLFSFSFFFSVLFIHTCHQFLQYFILKQQWVLDSKTHSEWENPFHIILSHFASMLYAVAKCHSQYNLSSLREKWRQGVVRMTTIYSICVIGRKKLLVKYEKMGLWQLLKFFLLFFFQPVLLILFTFLPFFFALFIFSASGSF